MRLSNRAAKYVAAGLLTGFTTAWAGTVSVSQDRILLDGEPVKLLGVRCSNALISDETTGDLIGALDLYQAHGLNTVSVFLMGSRFGDVKGYRPDGSMDPVYLGRLQSILEATRSRNMVMIVGCLYWSTARAKADLQHWTQDDANRAIANTARWLGEQGFTHVILDPDNEGMAVREMGWETESMVQAAKQANPSLLVANNTKMNAPGADLNMHFGPKVKGKPWLDSESTPHKNVPWSSYWGRYSKQTHRENAEFYNYSRIGAYTEEMKAAQLERTRAYMEEYSGILLASTWLQCSPNAGIGGPFAQPGGRSMMGSGDDENAPWNRDIDQLHPDAGVRWWFEYVREHYGPKHTAP